MISNKDAEWFCQNIEQMKQALFQVALLILPNACDGEDAASNAVLKAFQSFDRLGQKRFFIRG